MNDKFKAILENIDEKDREMMTHYLYEATNKPTAYSITLTDGAIQKLKSLVSYLNVPVAYLLSEMIDSYLDKIQKMRGISVPMVNPNEKLTHGARRSLKLTPKEKKMKKLASSLAEFFGEEGK